MKPGDEFICTENYYYVVREPVFIKNKTYTVDYFRITNQGLNTTFFTICNIELFDWEINRYFKPKFKYGK